MIELKQNWEPLSFTNFNELAETSNTVHQAAQFIAMAGKHFVSEKPDDSHTTAIWHPNKKWLVGQKIKTSDKSIRLVLDYNEFALLIIDDDLISYHRKELAGLTKNEVFLWLSLALHDAGLDTSSFNDKMQYEIPDHLVDHNGVFSIDNPECLSELARYRSNGHLVLTQLAVAFSSSNPVYIWPHHFDEGCYVPFQFENSEAISSLSFGLAMPDVYYNNPYFYVTTWKKKGDNISKLPELPPPGKWHTHEWKGQVLEAKNLVELSSKDQLETTLEFMELAIENARRLIGWVYK